MNLQTVRTAANELNVSEAAIRRAMADGKLAVLMLGNRTLVDVDEVREKVNPIVSGLTIDELSQQTGLSVSAIYRGVHEGWIPWSGKNGKAYRFDLDTVQKALRKRMNAKQGRPEGRLGPSDPQESPDRTRDAPQGAGRAKQ